MKKIQLLQGYISFDGKLSPPPDDIKSTDNSVSSPRRTWIFIRFLITSTNFYSRVNIYCNDCLSLVGANACISPRKQIIKYYIFGSWIAEKAGRAQKAAENGKQRKLHNDVKQLTGKGNEQTAAVRPSTQKVRAALMAFRNGKALGADQITAEMLKSDLVQTCQELKFTFDQIWKKEKVPKEWTKGLIYKIPKKDNLQECGNWKGATLLPLASKVLSRISTSRRRPCIKRKTGGFP